MADSRGAKVDAAFAGRRLDAALGVFLPGLGLRGRRRLIASGHVLVNGRSVPASRKLKAGDALDIELPGSPEPLQAGAESRVKLAGSSGDFLFFYKPRGLHSVSLAGAGSPSLEDVAGALARAERLPVPQLLQRLDYNTSGIICAGTGPVAVRFFRDAELAGKCRKLYLAVLSGRLGEPETARKALDCSRRKAGRILKEDAAPLLWTRFTPLLTLPKAGVFPEGNADLVTIAVCAIRKGQRHQIRLHAASIGHALAGDPLYGGEDRENFLLEHFHLAFPGHSFSYFAEDSLAGRLTEDKRRELENLMKPRQ